jgi:hypothetical protein
MRAFPMLLIAVALYNVAAFGGHLFNGTEDMGTMLDASYKVTMFSGAVWPFRLGDFLVLFALVMLFIEVIRATRTTKVEIYNHAFSTLVFVAALVEFLVVPRFATSAFFFIVVMCLFDIVAGFAISVVAARRDLGLGAMDDGHHTSAI